MLVVGVSLWSTSAQAAIAGAPRNEEGSGSVQINAGLKH